MVDVLNLPVDSRPQVKIRRRSGLISTTSSAAASEIDSRGRIDDRDLDLPPNRRGECDGRNCLSFLPPPRERNYKRRASPSPPPPYQDRRGHSPPRRSPLPFRQSLDGHRVTSRGDYEPGDKKGSKEESL